MVYMRSAVPQSSQGNHQQYLTVWLRLWEGHRPHTNAGMTHKLDTFSNKICTCKNTKQTSTLSCVEKKKKVKKQLPVHTKHAHFWTDTHQTLIVQILVWPCKPERMTPGQSFPSQLTPALPAAVVTDRKKEVVVPPASFGPLCSTEMSRYVFPQSPRLVFSLFCVFACLCLRRHLNNYPIIHLYGVPKFHLVLNEARTVSCFFPKLPCLSFSVSTFNASLFKFMFIIIVLEWNSFQNH